MPCNCSGSSGCGGSCSGYPCAIASPCSYQTAPNIGSFCTAGAWSRGLCVTTTTGVPPGNPPAASFIFLFLLNVNNCSGSPLTQFQIRQQLQWFNGTTGTFCCLSDIDPDATVIVQTTSGTPNSYYTGCTSSTVSNVLSTSTSSLCCGNSIFKIIIMTSAPLYSVWSQSYLRPVLITSCGTTGGGCQNVRWNELMDGDCLPTPAP